MMNFTLPDGCRIHDITAGDLPEILAMSKLMNWNQTAADWELFIRHGDPVAMIHDGRVVATGAGIGWNKRLAWIGLVITLPEMRGKGVATCLMKELMNRYADFTSIKLDASAMGAPIYEKLGFVSERRVVRLSSQSPLAPDTSFEWRRLTREDLPLLLPVESGFTGTDRTSLFEHYLEHWPEMTLGACRGGKLHGYIMGRPGRMFRQAGPLIADSTATALALIKQWSALEPDKPFQLDIPDTQPELLETLKSLGFNFERDFLRMHYGAPCGDWDQQNFYGIFGPEMG